MKPDISVAHVRVIGDEVKVSYKVAKKGCLKCDSLDVAFNKTTCDKCEKEERINEIL